MHRIAMSSKERVGSLQSGMPGCEMNGGQSAYVNINLKGCMQSIRDKPEDQRMEMGKPREESESIANVTRELVGSCSVQADLDEDMRMSPPTSSTDENSQASSSLDREVRRLKVLKSYLGVLDCDYGNKFDRLTALASRIFRSPMALLTIADLDKQYCISSRGLDFTTTRKSSFCSYAVLADTDILVIPDTTKDSRFSQDPQVATYPGVKFYAGATLVCPEGYRLGTLCVMDSKNRLGDVALDDKQSLMELAAMAMETLVELRRKKQHALEDPAKQISCTAHDLLTPLTGIALSLSLLREDEGLQKKLSEQQKDMIETAANCSTVMNSMCHKTMDAFRDQERSRATTQPKNSIPRRIGAPTAVKVSDLVKNLNMVMEPFPKHVPIMITVDPGVPPEFVSDDMKIFRSATNFLTNACVKTETGSIHFKIYTRMSVEKQKELVFECEDTGPGVDVAKYAYLFKPVQDEVDPLRSSKSSSVLNQSIPTDYRAAVENTGLGLYSVATQISSIGGKYGFRPRENKKGEPSRDLKGTGSVFWFTVPLIIPEKPPLPNSAVGTDAHASSPLRSQREKNNQKSGRNVSRISALLGKSGLAVRSSSVGSVCEQAPPSQRGGLKRKLNSEDALEVYSSTPRASIDMRNFQATARTQHALVIEDSLVVRKSLARVLSKLGFEVTQAVNGMEGLKELKSSLFDLVLCDFLMPVMDGLDCIQQYRQWEKVNRPYFRQYIVGISAHASEKDVTQGVTVGMNDFRSKPVTYKQLQELKNGKDFTRTSLALDQLGHEIECLKRRRGEPSPRSAGLPAFQRVCLVVEGTCVLSKLAKIASETIGWKVVAVKDGDNALGLLKMRNWDAVLVDDELGCSRCIAIFRDWEKHHRVNRQKNVVLMSANYAAAQSLGSSFQVPTGFDGALGKPIQLDALQNFLEKAKTSCDIVTR